MFSSPFQHIYKGVSYASAQLDEGGYACFLEGVVITGTHAKSRGEASMSLHLMIDEMQDRETTPMKPGDVLQFVDDEGHFHTAIICEISEDLISVRDHLGDAVFNFRGADSVFAQDQTAEVKLTGEQFFKFLERAKLEHYEWIGTMTVEFSAWRSDEKTVPGAWFPYTREVSMWCEPGVFEARVIHEAAKHGENSPS